jgi:hypothetical protein
MRTQKTVIGPDTMARLKGAIGKKVKIEFTLYGNPDTNEGVLRRVNDFTNLLYDGAATPFVGYGVAIKRVTEGERVLYHNPLVTDDYDIRDQEKRFEFLARTFGKVVADRFRKEAQEADEAHRREVERLNAKAAKKAGNLVEAGRLLVKKELAKAWVDYATLNTKDFYSAGVVQSAVNVMEGLTKGMKPEEAEGLVDGGITGFMMGCVASTVTHFHPRGDEFKAYWNGRWGVKDAKGVVNPAIITIGIRK